MIRKPPRLRVGDTVGVLSPSSPAASLYPHRLEQGVRALEDLGLKIRLGRNALRRTNWTAGSPEERTDDLHELWTSPDVRAIFAAIGGDHANQMLPLIDYSLIARHPKIILGYSDVTVLLLALHVRTGLVPFYGPAVLPEFGEYPRPMSYTLEHVRRALFSEDPVGGISPSTEWTDEFLDWAAGPEYQQQRNLVTNLGWRWLKPGHGEGKLMGGCLQSLMHLRGTQYWPNWRATLMFWEISDEYSSPAHVDSMLMDLDNSGVFERVRGMVVGRPCRYSPEQRAILDELVLSRT